MKQISHTINRAGELVPVNGFKKPTPTISCHNHGIWGHSIERTDAADPFKGFVILGLTIIGVWVILMLV